MGTQALLKETITVAQVGEFGVRVGDEWYGVNEPVETHDFVAGKTYDVLYKRGKPSDKYPQGKAYISQIVGEGQATTAASIAKPQAVEQAASQVASTGIDDAKGTRILRQGVYQAALQSPALAGFAATPDEYKALVKNVSEEMIKAIEGK